MSAASKNGCEKVYKSYLYNSRGHFSRSKLCKKMSTKSQRKLFDDYSRFLGGRWIEIVSKLSSNDRRKQFEICNRILFDFYTGLRHNAVDLCIYIALFPGSHC